VFRQIKHGRILGDVIGKFSETLPGEPPLQPLLTPVMRHGVACGRIGLEESRSRLRQEFSRLPEPLRGIDPAPAPYAVKFSACLRAELDRIRSEFARGTQNASATQEDQCYSPFKSHLET
jgi:hypothetical protein